jgi:hypothetical protein
MTLVDLGCCHGQWQFVLAVVGASEEQTCVVPLIRGHFNRIFIKSVLSH